MNNVGLAVRLGPDDHETSAMCHWNVPEAHYLESWSDVRGYDGTVTIFQPLIAPLYGGKTAHDVLGALTQQPDRSAHDIVKDHWQRAFKGATAIVWASRSREGLAFPDAETFWRTALHDGFISGTAMAAIQPPALQPMPDPAAPAPRLSRNDSLEIVFTADPTAYDGRFANNAWLQELPKPLTKITWDNAGYVSPRTAEQHGLANGVRWSPASGVRACAAGAAR